MARFGDRRQGSQTPQGSMVGAVRLPSGPMQFRARAMMRAVVVLPTPAHPGEHEGVRDAARGEGVAQRADQRVLADQAGEILRPVLARQHAIGLRARAPAELRGGGGASKPKPGSWLSSIVLSGAFGNRRRLADDPKRRLVTAASFRT